MKKLISIVLLLALCLSLAACGAKPADPDAGQPAEPDTPAEALPEIGVDTGSEEAEGEASAPSGSSMGQTLLSEFKAIMEADAQADIQQTAEQLLANPVIQFAGGSIPVEQGLLSGFGNAEITGFSEGVMFAPMIGSIAFVGYIFRLEDSADTAAFMETLKANADPRWNICVTAEETVIESVGNTVLFLMCPGTEG